MTAGPPHARMPSASANHPDAPVPHNTRNAALVGASTAFAKPPVKPKPAINTYSGNNGALAAARQTATPQPLLPQGTGNSTSSRASHASLSLKAGTAGSLGVPTMLGDRARSPSIVAATRAAAKHTPVADSSTSNRKSWNNASNESLPGSGHVGDIRSRFDGSFRIPSRSPPKHARISRSPSPKTMFQPKQSTASLVQPLQKRDVETSSSTKPPPRKPKPKPILTSQGPPPPVKSPKPQRNFTTPLAYPGLQQPTHEEVPLFPRAASVGRSGSSPVRSKPAPRPAPKPAKFSGEYRRASAASSSQVPLKAASPASLREVPAEAISDSDEDAPYLSAPESKEEETKAKPILPPPRRSNLIKPPPRTQSVDLTRGPLTPADDRASFLARSANHTPLSATNSRLQPTSSAYKRESAKMLEPHFTGDSLANAIVGASLATSRTSTPATAPPPPAPRRGGHQNKHHVKSRSRNPSPQKRPGHLLQTLRKEPSSSDDSDSGRDMKHKKKRHFRPKHPNKHKEGSRKRWRERVTERERKRYDGVWAANRGEFLSQEYHECVHGFVVKDIWSRSRLPPHVLEAIWDLVDHQGIGMLTREEFVVGMWVIDQALKGRKVPVKIQESVWESVKGLGVKVRKLRGGNRG